MKARMASIADCPLLARINHQLIRDEGHSNAMTVSELEQRMHNWISAGDYHAVLFERGALPVAYALYRLEVNGRVYLRRFFVPPEHRRQGSGRAAVELLFREIFLPIPELKSRPFPKMNPDVAFGHRWGSKNTRSGWNVCVLKPQLNSLRGGAETRGKKESGKRCY